MSQQQLPLFAFAQTKPLPSIEPPGPLPVHGARSHANDPATSDLAGEQFAKSGKLKCHQELVLGGVRRCSGGTHSEIAAVIPELQCLQVVRRLSELGKAGLIKKGEPRICTIKGSKCSTWWITTEDRR